jgi:hypothetical protein
MAQSRYERSRTLPTLGLKLYRRKSRMGASLQMGGASENLMMPVSALL